MEARAIVKYARISPRKVKIVLDLIRNKPVGVALGILKNKVRLIDTGILSSPFGSKESGVGCRKSSKTIRYITSFP